MRPEYPNIYDSRQAPKSRPIRRGWYTNKIDQSHPYDGNSLGEWGMDWILGVG
jgi:hypothetical protein